MQELSLQTQIVLIEIKARYNHLGKELDTVFDSAYPKETGTREKLALKMITEIKNALNNNRWLIHSFIAWCFTFSSC